jgi:tRNA(Ile)-lysidine synthase
MRPKSIAPVTHVRVVRPLLGWRRAELEQVCAAAGVTPAADPSNHDPKYERVRVRQAMSEAGWLDPGRSRDPQPISPMRTRHSIGPPSSMDPRGRRSAGRNPVQPERRAGRDPPAHRHRAIRKLASEGGAELRGPELDRLLSSLRNEETVTLRVCSAVAAPSGASPKAPARSA